VERTILDNPDFQRVLATNAPVRAESAQARELEYYFPILNYKDCGHATVRGRSSAAWPISGLRSRACTSRSLSSATPWAPSSSPSAPSSRASSSFPCTGPLCRRSSPSEGRRGASRRQITVDVAFHRIMSEERVENVMVIFQDRTEIVRAQKELAAA